MLDRPRTRDVDDGNGRRQCDLRGDHRALADDDSLDDRRTRADERSVLDDHRPGLWRLEYAADPGAPARWTSAPICAQDPTVAQVSTIVRGPTQAPILTKPGMRTTPLDRNEP